MKWIRDTWVIKRPSAVINHAMLCAAIDRYEASKHKKPALSDDEAIEEAIQRYKEKRRQRFRRIAFQRLVPASPPEGSKASGWAGMASWRATFLHRLRVSSLSRGLHAVAIFVMDTMFLRRAIHRG